MKKSLGVETLKTKAKVYREEIIIHGGVKMDKLEIEKIEKFLEYLQDKIEDCYKKETQQAINEFTKSIK